MEGGMRKEAGREEGWRQGGEKDGRGREGCKRDGEGEKGGREGGGVVSSEGGGMEWWKLRGTRRGRVVGRGLGLVADRHPVSSCCSHRVFVEWACCALVPCLRCRIVVIGATSLQAMWHLVLVGCPLVFVLWCHGGPIICCSW